MRKLHSASSEVVDELHGSAKTNFFAGEVKVFPGHVSVSLGAAFLEAPVWHFRLVLGGSQENPRDSLGIWRTSITKGLQGKGTL